MDDHCTKFVHGLQKHNWTICSRAIGLSKKHQNTVPKIRWYLTCSESVLYNRTDTMPCGNILGSFFVSPRQQVINCDSQKSVSFTMLQGVECVLDFQGFWVIVIYWKRSNMHRQSFSGWLSFGKKISKLGTGCHCFLKGGTQRPISVFAIPMSNDRIGTRNVVHGDELFHLMAGIFNASSMVMA